jgi:hypothetical protein
MQLWRVLRKTLFAQTISHEIRDNERQNKTNLLSVPFVNGFDIAKHHPLFSTLQVVRHWNITVWISDFGDVAVNK